MTDILRPDWSLLDNNLALPIGETESGDVVAFDPRIDAHALITGCSGRGKTVEAANLVYAALTRGHDVHIIGQRVRHDYSFAAPFAASVSDTFTDAAAALETVYAEIHRRHSRPFEERTARPETPILVFIDEFTHLAGGADQASVERAATIVTRIGREGRSAHVHLIYIASHVSMSSFESVPGARILGSLIAQMGFRTVKGNDKKVDRFRVGIAAEPLAPSFPGGGVVSSAAFDDTQPYRAWFATHDEFAYRLRHRLGR